MGGPQEVRLARSVNSRACSDMNRLSTLVAPFRRVSRYIAAVPIPVKRIGRPNQLLVIKCENNVGPPLTIAFLLHIVEVHPLVIVIISN